MLSEFYGGDRHSRCVIYARVSTKRQAEEGASLEVQLHLAQKYAADRGWQVVEKYVDAGASGRSEKGRPHFAEMLNRALSPDPPFTVILVYDHSRFFRNVGQSGTTRQALRLNGVEVRSITQPVRDDGLSGSMSIDIQAAVDQNQSALTALKVRDGMAASAREGFYVGGIIPFGYRLEMVEKRGKKVKNKLAIEPDEAAIVRRIFELHLGGLGVKSIVCTLNAERIPTRRGKQWYNSVVAHILSASTYVGRHPFKPTDWMTRRTVPKTEWIHIPCPPIIEEATFREVQRLLKARQPKITAPRITSSDVLLAKVGRCGSCGGSLQIQTGTSRNKTVYSYYKCAKRIGTGICPGGSPVSISRTALDEAVLSKLAQDLFSPDRLMTIVNEAASMHASVRTSATKRMAQLKRQIAAFEARESNLWDLAADLGLKGRVGFVAKLDAVQNEVAALKDLLFTQEQVVANAVAPVSDAEAARTAEKMRELLLSADAKQKKRFVNAIVKKVVVRENEIEITGAEMTLAACVTASGSADAPRFSSLPGHGGR